MTGLIIAIGSANLASAQALPDFALQAGAQPVSCPAKDVQGAGPAGLAVVSVTCGVANDPAGFERALSMIVAARRYQPSSPWKPLTAEQGDQFMVFTVIGSGPHPPYMYAVEVSSSPPLGQANVAVFQLAVGGSARPPSGAPSPSASRSLKTAFGDGVYAVGVNVAPGTYTTAGGANCYWARYSDLSGSQSSILANGNPTGPVTIQILPSDRGFETQGCGTWNVVSSNTQEAQRPGAAASQSTAGKSPAHTKGPSFGAVGHVTGDQAQLVANDANPDDPQLARLVFPMIPAGFLTQTVDVSLPYTLSVGGGSCDERSFTRALEARALVGWTFWAARSAKGYSDANGVAAGFYEAAWTTAVDNHGSMTKTLEVHPILLAIIDKKGLAQVVPSFGQGGVVSNGNTLMDPQCALGTMGFAGHQDEWGGLLAYSDSELAPYLKVFKANGGELYVNSQGFMFVSP